MIRRHILLVCLAVLLSCCPGAYAFTLTFDDIPAGSSLQYYSDQYGATFCEGFQVVDHSGSAWGLPHSAPNVLVWTADSSHVAQLTFGNGNLGSSGSIAPYCISSLTGYFSTDEGIVIRLYGIRNDPVYGPVPVADKWIGAAGQSWDSVRVDLRASDGGPIDYVVFDGPFSADARLGFCVDDMTITPVPEPSSLLAVLCALGCIGRLSLIRRKA